MTTEDFIGINWGSTNFRAYRIGADGTVRDERNAPAGVAMLDRDGMARTLSEALSDWGDCEHRYATGMIGSNIGWVTVPYVDCPAASIDLLRDDAQVRIAQTDVHIVPGLACTRPDGAPDVLRGEEMELFGALALSDCAPRYVVLPGTHTKWVRVEDGRLADFMTAMSGEIFDRLTAAGLLASIVDGPAAADETFAQGVQTGMAGERGLAVTLFGARARVVQGLLPASKAASYLRGLLIGAELRDARRAYPDLGDSPIVLVGNPALSLLYRDALRINGLESTIISARDACVAGFTALHRMRS